MVRVYDRRLLGWCQCPLGLISHFYVFLANPMDFVNWTVSMPSRADISFLRTDEEVQKLAAAGCQCPLGLISHFYYEDICNAFIIDNKVSMPSRADISFLRYPFKNLGFMRFPEPVFAGIYQNILTTAVFRAC